MLFMPISDVCFTIEKARSNSRVCVFVTRRLLVQACAVHRFRHFVYVCTVIRTTERVLVNSEEIASIVCSWNYRTVFTTYCSIVWFKNIFLRQILKNYIVFTNDRRWLRLNIHAYCKRSTVDSLMNVESDKPVIPKGGWPNSKNGHRNRS